MALTLRQRIGGWIAGQRDVSVAPPITFSPTLSFGPGLGTQPGHEALLRETIGIADAAVRAIANRVASLTLQVVAIKSEQAGTVVEEVLDDHPLAKLLAKPHPDFTTSQLLRLLAQHIVTVGEGYWLRVNSRLGLPAEIHPVPAGRVTPVWTAGSVSAYTVTNGSGDARTLTPDEMLRFWLPDPETVYSSEGYLGPMASEADGLKFAHRHLRAHYVDNATPRTVLKAGENAVGFQPESRDRFEHEWRQRYSSITGRSRGVPAILPTGYDLVQLGMQSGADLTPLLEHWRDDLLMAFGTPRSILGQVVSGDRSSAETNQFVFDRHTIQPIATLISETLTSKLAHAYDDALRVRFEPFVSDDKAFGLAQEQSDLLNKVRSVNQVREDRGLDPVSWGELPVATFGAVPYDGSGELIPIETPSAANEDRARGTRSAKPLVRVTAEAEWQRVVLREKQWIPAFDRGVRAVFAEQRAEVLRRYEALEQRARVDAADLFPVGEWGELWSQHVEPVRERAYRNTGRDALRLVGSDGEFIFGEAQQERLRNQNLRLIKHTDRSTQEAVRKILQDATAAGESGTKVTKRLAALFDRPRARTIARTETLKSTQAAQIDGFKQSEVVERKQWFTQRDAKVRDEHEALQGMVVDLSDDFVLGDGERAESPGVGAGGSDLSAHNAINCRCFVVPVIGGE